MISTWRNWIKQIKIEYTHWGSFGDSVAKYVNSQRRQICWPRCPPAQGHIRVHSTRIHGFIHYMFQSQTWIQSNLFRYISTMSPMVWIATCDRLRSIEFNKARNNGRTEYQYYLLTKQWSGIICYLVLQRLVHSESSCRFLTHMLKD